MSIRMIRCISWSVLLEKEFRKLEDKGKGKGIMLKVEFLSKSWTC
jgi:hypothetical protein